VRDLFFFIRLICVWCWVVSDHALTIFDHHLLMRKITWTVVHVLGFSRTCLDFAYRYRFLDDHGFICMYESCHFDHRRIYNANKT
jgi:hypothetical protein